MPVTTIMDLTNLGEVKTIERLVDWVRYPRAGLHEWGEVIAPVPGGPSFPNVQHTIRLVGAMPTRTGVQKVVNVILPSMAWEVIPNRRSLWDYEQSSPIEKAYIEAAVESMGGEERQRMKDDPGFMESISRYLDSLTSESRAQLFAGSGGAEIGYP